jgi:hypothetical protein
VLRRAGVLAPLAVVLLAGQALATTAPAKVCRILRDPAGDAGATVPTPGEPVRVLPGGATDDLLSADVASDGRTVTAVLRLADVVGTDLVAPTGHGYSMSFRVRGSEREQFLQARTYATGTQFSYGYRYTDAAGLTYVRVVGAARGTVDPARNEVRVHVPATVLQGRVRKGSVLLDLHASTFRLWGQGVVGPRDVQGVTVPLDGTATTFDSGDADRYVVGTPSCVRPGA